MKLSSIVIIVSALVLAACRVVVVDPPRHPVATELPQGSTVVYCPKIDSNCFDIASTLCGSPELGSEGYSADHSYHTGVWHSIGQPSPDDPNGDNAAVWDASKNKWKMVVECVSSL